MKFLLSKTNFFKTMNFSKIISSTVFATSISLFSTLVIGTDKVKAEACPDPSTYTSMLGDEATSWLNDPDLEGGCDGTPEVYGVTVYKMGLCEDNPFDGISTLATTAGQSPTYTSCSWTYVNDSGEYKSFSSTSTATLTAGTSSLPVAGTYPFAVIVLEPVFKIQDSYGPIKPLTTSTEAVTYVSSATSATALTTGSAATRSMDLTSFMGNPDDIPGTEDGEEVCNASDAVDPISGKGQITGWLVDSDGKTIADNAAIATCTGVDKLIGVMDMTTSASGPGPVTVTSTTTGITATFDVSENGSGIYYKGGSCTPSSSESCLTIDGGPFSVTFDVTDG